MTDIYTSSFQTRLGASHGYLFEGDFVRLNAEVSFSDADLASDQAWALQLWSSSQGFAGGLNGVKVAEVALTPMAGGIVVDALCAAMPPAGSGEQTLALALVAFPDGKAELRDLAVYAAGENFYQPTLSGNVDCLLADGTAELFLASISNPRGVDNLSGTLSLEVWALDAPYAGGSWAGTPVASLILGVLAGGEAWNDCRFSVPAALPTEGSALTVMLREWTPAGYVTRDYRNFAAAPALPDEAPVVAASPEPAAVLAPAIKAEAKPAKATKVAAPKKKVEVDKAEVKVSSKAAAAKPVSVNKASEAELSAVKGLSVAVVRAIIAARPYAKLDEISKAKGVGPKLLEKLRDLLTL